uniref:Uncharacterized protein n=1 Tax=Rhizophora mucronata TaxID=61149 RepID=A0A2P2PQT7_RHIMU
MLNHHPQVSFSHLLGLLALLVVCLEISLGVLPLPNSLPNPCSFFSVSSLLFNFS